MILSRKDVDPICKDIAKDMEGWEYIPSWHGGSFKNKKYTIHSDAIINVGWIYNIMGTPAVEIYNKNVASILKEMYPDTPRTYKNTIISMDILEPGATGEGRQYRKLIYSISEAEEYVREIIDMGLGLLDVYFPKNNNEIEFIRKYPINNIFPDRSIVNKRESGANCISRAVILDFDYVEEFLEAASPQSRFAMRVNQWLPIWKARAAETGSILKPKEKRK